MRIPADRGQALLLLVVAGLTVAAIGSAALAHEGLPAPVVTTVSELLAPPRHGLPARIQISSPVAQQSSPELDAANGHVRGGGSVAYSESVLPASTPTPGGAASSRTTVVTGSVFAYPPDDHGGGSSGGGGTGGGGGGGSGGGKGPSGSHR